MAFTKSSTSDLIKNYNSSREYMIATLHSELKTNLDFCKNLLILLENYTEESEDKMIKSLFNPDYIKSVIKGFPFSKNYSQWDKKTLNKHLHYAKKKLQHICEDYDEFSKIVNNYLNRGEDHSVFTQETKDNHLIIYRIMYIRNKLEQDKQNRNKQQNDKIKQLSQKEVLNLYLEAIEITKNQPRFNLEHKNYCRDYNKYIQQYCKDDDGQLLSKEQRANAKLKLALAIMNFDIISTTNKDIKKILAVLEKMHTLNPDHSFFKYNHDICKILEDINRCFLDSKESVLVDWQSDFVFLKDPFGIIQQVLTRNKKVYSQQFQMTPKNWENIINVIKKSESNALNQYAITICAILFRNESNQDKATILKDHIVTLGLQKLCLDPLKIKEMLDEKKGADKYILNLLQKIEEEYKIHLDQYKKIEELEPVLLYKVINFVNACNAKGFYELAYNICTKIRNNYVDINLTALQRLQIEEEQQKALAIQKDILANLVEANKILEKLNQPVIKTKNPKPKSSTKKDILTLSSKNLIDMLSSPNSVENNITYKKSKHKKSKLKKDFIKDDKILKDIFDTLENRIKDYLQNNEFEKRKKIM